jgi:cell shape-determining protein MreD
LLTDVVEANLFASMRWHMQFLVLPLDIFIAGYCFPLWQQALHVLGLLLIAQAVVLVLRLMSGASLPVQHWYWAASAAR